MALDEIFRQVPIDDIAAKLGVSHEEAKVAVEQGGAVLLRGLSDNAKSAEGSAAIQKALGKHQGKTAAAKVDDIDQADGGKIVNHILGSKKQEVTEKLTESKATAAVDFGKLLPILAPIVMGLIANATKSKGQKADAGARDDAQNSGGLGDLIGGLLGGGSSGNPGGVDLGGILGGLFGKK